MHNIYLSESQVSIDRNNTPLVRYFFFDVLNNWFYFDIRMLTLLFLLPESIWNQLEEGTTPTC